MARSTRPVIMLPVEQAELDKIRASAHRAHMTVPSYLRKKLGLPQFEVKRPGRPARMKQADLFNGVAEGAAPSPAEVPEAPESSKRASDAAIPVADDTRSVG